MSVLQEVKVQTAVTVVDANRPWPGLVPFKEEQREYFFGRDDEIDELLQCVKRDAVTLLFGKSGLGKSSVLQAGLFPELRKACFLPVYIHLRFGEDAGALEAQVKSTLEAAIKDGELAEAALPGRDEPLWEYLHRRGGNLTASSGDAVCPVLVFDQFEEIFTLGGSNNAVRKRRDQFLACFADLVENSIPETLRARLVENPRLAAEFDFSTAGCRIVVSMREDYLAKLEQLRSLIPSLALATSRMRLTEMNGEQALLAVSRPNPQLMSDKVAREIVRFVAGASFDATQPKPGGEEKKLEDLEVAPAILSLFCRELSIKRGDAPQITSDLVAGNAKTIIDDFYRRCLDGKDKAVRCLIEDRLVTKQGYRDNIDLGQAKEELEQAHVPSAVVDELVEQRLLHVEEHRGVPRLELTHDVLLEPIRRSRDARLQQEALEQKQDEARQAQERANKKVRFYQIVAVTTGLVMFMLVGLLVWGWRANQVAKREKAATLLESEAKQQALEAAKTARVDAEAHASSEEAAKKLAVENAKTAKENEGLTMDVASSIVNNMDSPVRYNPDSRNVIYGSLSAVADELEKLNDRSDEPIIRALLAHTYAQMALIQRLDKKYSYKGGLVPEARKIVDHLDPQGDTQALGEQIEAIRDIVEQLTDDGDLKGAQQEARLGLRLCDAHMPADPAGRLQVRAYQCELMQQLGILEYKKNNKESATTHYEQATVELQKAINEARGASQSLRPDERKRLSALIDSSLSGLPYFEIFAGHPVDAVLHANQAVAKAEAEGDWQSAENAYMNLAHAYLFSNKTQEARKIYKKRGPNNIDWYGSTFAMGVRDDFDNFRKAGVVDPMIQKEMLVIEDEDLRDATKPSDPSH